MLTARSFNPVLVDSLKSHDRGWGLVAEEDATNPYHIPRVE
jgi:hypothetical protein